MNVAPIVLALQGRRLALGLSRLEVAEMLNVSFRTIWAWETGDRSASALMVEAYAKALNATLTLVPPLPDSQDLDDEVLIQRACAGTVPWRQLTKTQRLEVYRRLQAKGWSQQRILGHLHIGGAVLAALEEQLRNQRGAAA